MRDYILTCSALDIAVTGLVFFAGIYTLFGTVNAFLTRHLLPKLEWGRPLDPRPIARGQVKRELLLSLSSIAIFGVGLILPWWLVQLRWAELAIAPTRLQVMIEVVVLLLWNEVHFYVNHWLLHTRWLKRFHVPHHRSVVTTPWSTYAFHPVEAMMLGKVLIVPMLLHDFSVYGLISVPVFSLLFNSIGHSNYDWNPTGRTFFHKASRRHHLHHACFNGNYGFMFPFMDKLFKTALPFSAADKQLSRWKVE